jgi:shikimate kinase
MFIETTFSSLKNNSVELKEQFYRELKNIKNNKTDTLLKILKNEKSIRSKFFICDTPNVELHYIIFIVGMNDSVLLKLGQSPCAFPRGFAIVWYPNNLLHIFGFLPKFQNDTRQIKYTEDEFDGYNSNISFFKKWSGFLGQLLVYKIEDKVCVSGSSKNSISNDSMYVVESRDLFRDFLNKKFIDKLIDEKLHICAEMMSLKDQTHGAQVLKPTPVITAICKGTVYDIKNNTIDDNNDKHKFVIPLPQNKVVELCNQFKLPVDSNISISGQISVNKFLTNLCENRDFMDDNKFEKLITDSKDSSYTIHKGTVTHKEILGNILEGLVLHLTGPKGTKIIKFKFPIYTCRTFFLRELIVKDPELHDYNIIPALNKWCKFWCISDAGAEYWRNIMLIACDSIKNNKIKDDIDIGLHIRASDYALKHSDILVSNSTITYSGTIIIITGPIGFGKTTLGNLIANTDNKYIHIDGDILGLTMNDVANLSLERATYTLWLIYKALMQNKIPIISTGGGVLFHGKKDDFILPDNIYKIFGINVKIISILPNDINVSYNDEETLKDIIEIRNKNGYWNAESKKIILASTKNIKFAKAIKACSDYTIYFERQTQNSVLNLDIIDKLNKNIISIDKNKFNSGLFSQNRLLTLVQDIPKFKHITLKYSDKNDIELIAKTKNINYKRNNQDGYIITHKTGFSLVVMKNMNNIRYHVTLNAGNFEPVLMGNIAEALNSGKSKIELLNKKNILISIELNKLEDYKTVPVDIVDNYYI